MKRIFVGSTILLLILAAAPAVASAEDTNGLEGVWDAHITVSDCNGHFLRSVRSFDMYIHDGSVSAAGGTVAGTGLPLPRTNAVGSWQHLQGRTFSAVFRFFGLNTDGALVTIATATRKLELNGDTLTATDKLTVTDLNGVVLNTACSDVTATRLATH